MSEGRGGSICLVKPYTIISRLEFISLQLPWRSRFYFDEIATAADSLSTRVRNISYFHPLCLVYWALDDDFNWRARRLIFLVSLETLEPLLGKSSAQTEHWNKSKPIKICQCVYVNDYYFMLTTANGIQMRYFPQKSLPWIRFSKSIWAFCYWFCPFFHNFFPQNAPIL